MSSTPARPQLQHIPELDGIRGIAALMVLFHHLLFTSIPNPAQWNTLVVMASSLGHAGGYGVDLFFVLSGFLITSLLLLDRASPNYYWNFYWKRVLRILPLYLVVLICLVAVMPQSWRYALLSLVFLANFAQLFHIASAGPFWTLAIEEQFYLLWPQFARRLTVSGLERFALTIAIACPVLRLTDAAFHHYNYLFTFFHCDGLALGAFFACRQFRLQSCLPQQTRKNQTRRDVALVVVAISVAAFPLAFTPDSPAAHTAEALQLSGISLLCYCVIAAAVKHSGSSWLAVLRSPAVVFFGSISYCLYIANSYVVILYDHFRGPMQTGDMQQYVVRAAAVCCITIAVCIVSRYTIELPAMSLRKLLHAPR